MITIKSNQYKLLIYIITVCHLLAGCSDDLFGGDESRGSGNRITLSGEIDQLAVTRVNDSGFADGDVMGVYIVDYNGNTPGTLQPSGNRADNGAIHTTPPTPNGTLPTTSTGKMTTHTLTSTDTIPSAVRRA